MRFIQRLALLMLVAFPVWADELRIEANNLNQNLTKYVVLDARSVDLYQSLHIDGALNFPAAFTYHNQEIDGKISKPEKMQKYIRAFGYYGCACSCRGGGIGCDTGYWDANC